MATTLDGKTQPALAELTPHQREQAMTRFAVLQPVIDDHVPLAKVARDADIPLRTARRWLARYRTDGLVGLARSARSDAGHRKLAAELVTLIEGMALRKPQPSITAIHRRVVAMAKEQAWPLPSYSSVYGIVRHLNPAMVTLAQAGQASS